MGGVMGNVTQGGRIFRRKKNDYWYYDKLPPAAREALANAKFCWSSGFFYEKWKRQEPGFKTGEDIAKHIAEWDSETIQETILSAIWRAI
jgi:hypothetical protein